MEYIIYDSNSINIVKQQDVQGAIPIIIFFYTNSSHSSLDESNPTLILNKN